MQLIIVGRTADKDVKEVGEEFCTNTIIKKVSFTGSTPVGKLLMKLSSNTVKRLSLELGGCAAFVVFEDAGMSLVVLVHLLLLTFSSNDF
jgi:succinate-semialdehyde dehydrogenase/glutarate-semialdehyde dehydrogenase